VSDRVTWQTIGQCLFGITIEYHFPQHEGINLSKADFTQKRGLLRRRVCVPVCAGVGAGLDMRYTRGNADKRQDVRGHAA
jgi:hypothetical protein